MGDFFEDGELGDLIQSKNTGVWLESAGPHPAQNSAASANRTSPKASTTYIYVRDSGDPDLRSNR